MTEPFNFCTRTHVTFFTGYLDAVGRVLTTETELWALTARDSENDVNNDQVLGMAIRERSVVENWSKEFGLLVDGFLKMNQRSCLGFYLVDYICWFKEFTKNAECLKIECDAMQEGTIKQAVYALQLENNHSVLLLFSQIDKTHPDRLKWLNETISV